MSILNLPIVVRGAREHNLRDVDVSLPRNQLICFTGVSGSGKSSLAFDTIFAEGQRRYLESLSTYARQFIGQLPKPDVDFLSGLSPSISISQKSSGNNPRSTVGTMTEIQDFLRVLFARVGTGFCPSCDGPITAQTRDQIVARIGQLPTEPTYAILAPIIRGQKGEYRDLFEDLRKQGFNRARVDGKIVTLNDPPVLEKLLKHHIEVVVDRIQLGNSGRQRIAEAVDTAIRMGEGTMLVVPIDDESNEIVFSADYACPKCGTSYPPPSPQLMSFNSPLGMCQACNGLGELYTMDPALLIPDDKKSLRQGAVVLLGKWTQMSRWQRIALQSVSSGIEPSLGMAKGEMLTTPWRDLSDEVKAIWLYGTGERTITYTVRGGSNPKKFGAQFAGIIPQLVSSWNNFKNPMQKRQYEKYMHQLPCGVCHGARLNAQARFVKLASNATTDGQTEVVAIKPKRTKKSASVSASSPSTNSQVAAVWRSLPEIGHMALGDALEFFKKIELNELQTKIAGEALKEIKSRLSFLLDVGLGYLSLDRTAPTLSGGESQRIRLASQIGAGLVGVTYVLDEPSIGLHPRDNDRLLSALKRLRDLGNTVLVVEHDEDTMHAADTIVDFGPGPGVRGGKLIAQGSADDLMASQESLTGQYMSGRLVVPTPEKRRKGSGNKLKLKGVSKNNLRDMDVELPLGCLICVTGVSGSGKSSLITEVLTPLLLNRLNGAEQEVTGYKSVSGIEHLDKIIDIDQSPIGRTPRSNPATYVKVFDEIRDLYARLPESKKRGYLPGRFSFNTEGGRCEACEGNGSNRLDMEMLADLWITCPVCNGRRYDHETLNVLFKGKSIADCLEMDIQDALIHFDAIPKIKEKLQTLHDVGLDYLKLGQPSPTLSGGEAQRIKLSKELSRRSTGKTLYVLDEPTTGLHFHDIAMLLRVLQSLVELGNTVIVVEHNLDLIQAADWIIDLGPEGGAAGGQILDIGTPEHLAKNKQSATGVALARYFDSVQSKRDRHASTRKRQDALSKLKVETLSTPALKPLKNGPKNSKIALESKDFKPVIGLSDLIVQGAETHNLQSVDLRLPHGLMTVFCGKSGSGKTSLAFDTIYAEGQRRYTESLSSYARQFVGQMPKPVVHKVEGLAPSIALEQRKLGHTPRSTVGTVTEIYDYFRVLMARLSTIHCPQCDRPVETQTLDQIVENVMSLAKGTKAMILAPVDGENGREIVLDESFFADLQARGFVRVRINGKTTLIDERPELAARGRYRLEVVVDRVAIDAANRGRLTDSLETALDLGKGTIRLAIADEKRAEEKWETQTHSLTMACHHCGISYQPLTPHSFSFNTAVGWCEDCEGLGIRRGTNPAALMDASKSLLEGGVLLWPNLDQKLGRQMLDVFCEATGIPSDQPIGLLSIKHRNALLFGTGDQQFTMSNFSFRYRGLYPTLDVAARTSPAARFRLESFTAEVECISCRGSRLRPEAAKARWRGLTIAEIVNMSLGELQSILGSWKLDKREQKIAGELIREIESRLGFLNEIGLDYLFLSRAANSLSGGEAQRIRLAAQLGSGLCGVLYVLDEPTIGLHPRDNHRLLKALHRLRDLGNSLIVVEHDRDVIAGSDQLCDFGPGSGVDGGRIVAQGNLKKVSREKASVTGPYLSGAKSIPIPKNRRLVVPIEAIAKGRKKADEAPKEAAGNSWLSIRGAKANTLRDIDVDIPLHCLVSVTGPSGSGKSSLINDILYPALARRLHRAQLQAGPHRLIDGWKQLDKVVRVDQSPLGSSPSSTPATYTGVFDLIRELYSKLPDAKVRGFTPRQFSFNVPGGRCEKCEGNGQCRIEMHFLPDVWVECDACHGRRFNEETLTVRYQGKTIHDVLTMKISQARELFANIPKIRRILATLCDVGLDYLSLGQSASTLSGGEAQRVKLAAELARPATGKTLYLLDEPTTGLHFDDIAKLLNVLHRLVDVGNTVVVIEHNLDVIKSSDWVIELGPDAGWQGGQLVFAGPPESLVAYAQSTPPFQNTTRLREKAASYGISSNNGKANSQLRCHTGEALAAILNNGHHEERIVYDPNTEWAKLPGDQSFNDIAKQSLSPWQVDGRKWHLETGLDRKGKPVLWDRSMLKPLVDKIEASGIFGEIDWNSSSLFEVPAKVKSRGWFLHAFTAESPWLKLKFRIPKGYFTKGQLLEMFKLPPLSQMEGIQAYNREARSYVEVATDWLELELRLHLRSELDNSVTWKWLDQAMKAFDEATSDH
jgi:excinuclease ABC subunit A